eukprot:GHVT01024549.1.p1 GENE.GHVT01024549.1~~GHVT01024549.1.p1  ORF type:complete len:290 (-),score=41.40 GHVT01024549.1:80-949(-)
MAVTLRGLLAGWIFFLLLLQSNDNPHTRCDYEAAPLCIPFSFSSFSFSSFSQSSSFSPSRSCLRRCRFVDWFGCGGCGTSWFGFGSGPWMVSAQRADGLFSTDMLCIGLGCDWIRCADSSDCPPLHVCSALGAHTAAEGFLGGGGLGVKRLVQQQSRQAGGLIGNSPAYLRGAVLGSWQGLLADSSNLKQEHNPFMYFINKNVCSKRNAKANYQLASRRASQQSDEAFTRREIAQDPKGNALADLSRWTPFTLPTLFTLRFSRYLLHDLKTGKRNSRVSRFIFVLLCNT